MRLKIALGVTVCGLIVTTASAQEPAANALMKQPAVHAALDAVKANEAQTITDQIRFCEIPAPEFKEEARGKELQRVFQQIGLQNIRVDKVGNVLGDDVGAPHPHLVIAAHLDTVFPEGTDVHVKREGIFCADPASATTAAGSASWCRSRAK